MYKEASNQKVIENSHPKSRNSNSKYNLEIPNNQKLTKKDPCSVCDRMLQDYLLLLEEQIEAFEDYDTLAKNSVVELEVTDHKYKNHGRIADE